MQSHPTLVKSLGPGRVVVVDAQHHRNTLGLILKGPTTSRREKLYPTLVICEQNPVDDGWVEDKDSEESDWSLPRPVLTNQLFRPEGQCGQELLELGLKDFAVVTTTTLKVDTNAVLENCKRRQIPRFK